MERLLDNMAKKRYLRMLRGRRLTAAQVEAIADWQLQLPPEHVNCALLSACEAYLHPQEATGMEASLARLRLALQNEKAPERIPSRRAPRRAVLLAVLIVLLLGLAAAAIALVLQRGIFNFGFDILPNHDYSVQPNAQTLVEKNLSSLSLAHVDIAVREAVYDGRELRVVYAVTDKAPKAAFTQEELSFPRSDAASLDGVVTCDWIELNGESAYISDNFFAIGENPGEMLYYLTTRPHQWGISLEGEFTVGLPLLQKGQRGTVPPELLFTMDAGLAQGLLQTALPASLEMEGHAFTLAGGLFTATGADLSLTVAGPEVQAREALAHRWGDALLFTPLGEAVGGFWNVHWVFLENAVTVVYEFTPPASWPQEMVLALPDAGGKPDMEKSIPVRLSPGQ